MKMLQKILQSNKHSVVCQIMCACGSSNTAWLAAGYGWLRRVAAAADDAAFRSNAVSMDT